MQKSCLPEGREKTIQSWRAKQQAKAAWPQRSLQDGHQEVQLPEGTAVATTEARPVLDESADGFQLFVAHVALLEPGSRRKAAGKRGCTTLEGSNMILLIFIMHSQSKELAKQWSLHH